MFDCAHEQTTVEYYQNALRRERASARGEVFVNPFDQGWRANWAQVFGAGSILWSVMPRRRKPPPPVVPFLGATAGGVGSSRLIHHHHSVAAGAANAAATEDTDALLQGQHIV